MREEARCFTVNHSHRQHRSSSIQQLSLSPRSVRSSGHFDVGKEAHAACGYDNVAFAFYILPRRQENGRVMACRSEGTSDGASVATEGIGDRRMQENPNAQPQPLCVSCEMRRLSCPSHFFEDRAGAMQTPVWSDKLAGDR